jgi:hypothetical protein
MTLTIGQPDIVALELACLTAVPAQRVAFDGSFVVRGFLGGTGRANSASSLSAEAIGVISFHATVHCGRWRAPGLQRP